MANKFGKHRITQARLKLREKLSFEKIRSIPKYKNLTKIQYEVLIARIGTLALLLLESYQVIETQ